MLASSEAEDHIEMEKLNITRNKLLSYREVCHGFMNTFSESEARS